MATPQGLKADFQDWLRSISEHHIPGMVVASVSVFSVVLGAIFFFDADAFKNSITFSMTFKWAGPEAWGVVLGITGILLGWLYWLDGSSGKAPAFVLTLLYMAIGFTAGFAPIAGIGGLLSASAVYTFVGIISAICIFACVPRKGRRGKAARNYF